MRTSRVFWGIVLALAGVVLLLQNLGIIHTHFWPIFWALLIILVGVWILLGPVLARREAREEALSLPLEGAQEASITLKHGAGRIQLDALQTPGELLTGTFGGGVEKSYTPGAAAQLQLAPPSDGFWVPFGPNPGFNWKLAVNRDIPIHLKLETGAGEALLNLADLQVKDLRIETGASSTEVTLPERAGFTQVLIKAGAASVKVRVPQGVAANIQLETGLSGNRVDEGRFPRLEANHYRSSDYETAANRVELRVEAGVGSFEIN